MTDLRTALDRVRYWAEQAMEDSKPNSNFYAAARSDFDWAVHELRELDQRRES